MNLAIVGGGRAGAARARALAQHPEGRLWGTVHRGGEPTFGQALAEPAVDGVLICTPNLLHAEQVRTALAAGKHVLCEYPLAATADEASRLLAAARERGQVLHVGHIELLGESHRLQRARAAELGRPLGGEVEFTGASEGWVGDGAVAGSPALRATARLHRLVDLFGSARVRAAALEESASGYRLEVALEFEAGGEVTLREQRAPGAARRTTSAIRCERGPLGDPPAIPPTGVFRADLDCFLARVLRGAAPYLAEERILHVLGLVERIDALSGWKG